MADKRKSLTGRARRFFEIFPHICDYITDELGPKPFSPKGPLNVAILDAVFIAIARRWPAKPKILSERVRELIANPDFIDLYSSRTADTEVVRRRLRMAAQALFQ